jgi:Family of unknown function (DUF6074)
MSERKRLTRIAADHRPAAAPRSADAPFHIEIARPSAKILILPGRFRGAAYVKTHVQYVVRMEAEKGERHIRRNLGAIEAKLREMGVGDAAITAELREIESAVRAELWRQILTPEDDT